MRNDAIKAMLQVCSLANQNTTLKAPKRGNPKKPIVEGDQNTEAQILLGLLVLKQSQHFLEAKYRVSSGSILQLLKDYKQEVQLKRTTGWKKQKKCDRKN